MSSIRTVQTERLLQDVVRTLYSSGTQPLLDSIMGRMARYFSKYPAGKPLPMPLTNILDGMVSDPHKYNTLLRHVSVNIDVLYETSLRQVEEVMMLTSSMQTDLDRLNHKRKRIETKIDDFLLSQNNTDGYFYSISDNFSDLGLINLYLTSAEIDTDSGTAILPTSSETTSTVPKEWVSAPSLTVRANGSIVQHTELAPFSGALEDSLDNIVWAFEVETEQPGEVIVEATIRLGGDHPVHLSRIDLVPYGSSPVQVFFETRHEEGWQGFGSKIERSVNKMSFGSPLEEVRDVKMILRKVDPDYSENKNGVMVYKYIFGAREIRFIHQVYERDARVVSEPLMMPQDYEGNAAIDAVSLAVESNIPGDCDIRYYVAPSDLSEIDFEEALPTLPEISDYVWHEIVPVDSSEPGDKIVRFAGAVTNTRMIRKNPRSNDMQIIPMKDSGPVQERNPTPSIIPGVDVYKIAELEDQPFNNSMVLLEGVNTTRIYSKNIDEIIPFNEIDMPYWSQIFATQNPTVDFGRIDTGNEFFYGGDIGAVGKDIYVETYLHADRSWSTFLAEFQKVDPRSRTWDIHIYLNGKPLGHLPSGTDKMQLPWNFKEGLNHVVLLIRIPTSSELTDLFMGAVSLFGRGHLYDYGSVYLSRWSYVDLFTMKYNESGQPKTFTVHENELISRRKPTTNYQLKYTTGTGQGPRAVLLRADMSRANNNPNVSPELRKYRVRFSYAEG